MAHTCSACSRGFTTAACLTSHIWSKQNCQRNCSDAQKAAWHAEKDAWEALKRHWCANCSYRTDNWDALEAHWWHCSKTEEEKQKELDIAKPFPCKNCGRAFATDGAKEAHEFACGLSPAELQAQYEELTPHVCRCGRRFGWKEGKGGLDNHAAMCE